MTSMLLVTIFFAFMVSWALIPYLIPMAEQYGFTDAPGDRKVHSGLMPRIGGVAIFAGMLAAITASCNFDRRVIGYLVGAAIIFIVGLVDDKQGMSANVKLFWQVVAVVVMLKVGNVVLTRLDDLPFGFTIHMGKLGWPVTVFLMLSIINSVNLIDGLDGLASGISIIAGVGMALTAFLTNNGNVMVIATSMIGATLAFYFYNKHPARIFMGDSGSLFLGYSLASLSILLVKNPSPVGLTSPLLLLLIPVGDVFYVAIRRKMSGGRIFQADKTHIHHRLLDQGFSHRGAVRFILAMTMFFTAYAVFAALNNTATH